MSIEELKAAAEAVIRWPVTITELPADAGFSLHWTIRNAVDPEGTVKGMWLGVQEVALPAESLGLLLLQRIP